MFPSCILDAVRDDRRWQPRLAGVLAAAAALGVSRLLDSLSESAPSLVAVVGQAFIRIAPPTLERFAVGSVGTADKPILVVTTVVLSLMIGARVGRAAVARPRIGDLAFAGFAGLTVVAAAWVGHVSVAGTAASAGIAALVGALVLRRLIGSRDGVVAAAPVVDGASDPAPPAPGPYEGPGASGLSRRRFLTEGSLVAGGTALTLAGAWGLRRPGVTSQQRAAVRLPAPAEPVPVPADGLGLSTRGISPLVTPNRDFFRIDEALVVPSVDLTTWRLRLTGMLDRPYEVSFDELLAMPLVERHVTLSCVSNEVGGPLVGTARWLGVRLSDLLERAGVQPGADQLVGRSVDGFTAGFPVEAATDGRDALVAVGMNGEALPRRHGFPARLVVPGLYGYVSATKWLREIHLTTFDAFDAYWVERNWARRAPVKVQSRIDVPRDYANVTAGRLVVAGVAWAPNRGIEQVELSVDKGEWSPAHLGPSLADDAWRQWTWEWDAQPGNHVVDVRATTRDGEVQTANRKGSFPDGATGHHQCHLRVR